MHHGKRGGGKKKKKSVRSGVKTRIEARSLYEQDYDEYLAEYRAFIEQLVEPQRSLYLENIRARIEQCGPFGLIADETLRDELLAQGLLPYTEPNSLVDGIVPVDAVKLHDRCMSRRWVAQYAETHAEEFQAPRLADGLVITADDLERLDLLASDYRFINPLRPRTRPMPNVPFIAPVGLGVDDDNEDNGIIAVMTPAMEAEFEELRQNQFESESEEIERYLTSPDTGIEDFAGYMSDYQIDMPFEITRINAAGVAVAYRPRNPAAYPDSVTFDVRNAILNASENHFGLADKMVTEHYSNYERLSSVAREFYMAGLLGKLEFLFLNWSDENGQPYYFDRSEVDEIMIKAAHYQNVELLRLLDRFVTRMPRNPNPGRFTTLQNRIDREESFILPEQRRRYAAIRAEIDRFRSIAATRLTDRQQMRANMIIGEMYNLVERIHNLENLEYERERREEARFYRTPSTSTTVTQQQQQQQTDDDDLAEAIFVLPQRPTRPQQRPRQNDDNDMV